jgi:hypothetical protein
MALKFANNNFLSAITSLPDAISSGSLNLISTQTASSSSTIDFTSGIDSTYKEYIFKFINIHPSANGQNFGFQADTGTNTNYNQTITSTFFEAVHGEDGSGSGVSYKTAKDQAQGTGLQSLGQPGNETDLGMSGLLHLFEPSSSVFVKHFIARSNLTENGGVASDNHIAGYINTTTAITRVQFKSSSGTLDSGVIKLYGVS